MKQVPERVDRVDEFLSPVWIDERKDPLGVHPSRNKKRCSDKGFLAMAEADYLEILDWLARNRVAGKRGSTPVGARTIFERLGFDGLEESSSRSSPSPSSRRASRQSGTQAKRPSQAANFSD